MKILRLIILIAVLLSLIPFDGLCCEHGDAASAQHCIVSCHGVCHQALAPSIQTALRGPQMIFIEVRKYFSYDNPSIDPLQRPPVIA